jgi:hypothetical protein
MAIGETGKLFNCLFGYCLRKMVPYTKSILNRVAEFCLTLSVRDYTRL